MIYLVLNDTELHSKGKCLTTTLLRIVGEAFRNALKAFSYSKVLKKVGAILYLESAAKAFGNVNSTKHHLIG